MEVGDVLVEYKRPTREIYQQYHDNAYQILINVAEYHSVYLSEVTFDLIIDFFESNFNIRFVYFESNIAYNWFPNKKQELKYPLTRKNTLALVDYGFCSVCSGMTIPDFDKERYVVYINQDVVKSRVIFTLLHELSHIYCHLANSVYDKVLVSKTTSKYSESYPIEVAPLEDEANTIASILFLNDQRLLQYIEEGLTFDQLKERSQMSPPALHNRLMNFLMYNCRCQEYYALNIVQSYKHNQDWASFTLQQFQKELTT